MPERRGDMLPFANETVTLYHRIRDETGGRTSETWERRVLAGCSWRRTVRDRLVDGAVLKALETVCRIPPGQAVPVNGDLLVRGVCAETPATAREIALLEKSGADAFRVTAVSDNTAGPLPHIAARGD